MLAITRNQICASCEREALREPREMTPLFFSAPRLPVVASRILATADIPRLCEDLRCAIERDFGTPALSNNEGWVLESVQPIQFARLRPVAKFVREDATLCFIVAPTDPQEPAYRRSSRYDILYFSEDVPDAEQARIYARDRAMIDRFANWVIRWDQSEGETSLALASGSRAALVPLRVGGWACKALSLAGDDELVVRFESTNSSDWVEVTVLPRDAPGPLFRRLTHCSIKYRAGISMLTSERREQVAALLLAVGDSVDALLERAPGSSLAEALGRTRTAERIIFGRDTLRALLAPEIVEGAPFVEGFSLIDVYPTSYLREATRDELELVLDFRRAADERRLLLIVSRRDDARPGFATTTHFSLSHLSLGAADPSGADLLRALTAFVLQLHDHEALEVAFPDLSSDVSARMLQAAPGLIEATDEQLNLAIDAECGQSCVFCSIKETSPAKDGGDRTLARLFADLESNRQRGVQIVRINGYDPLGYSRILEVLRRARELGYAEAHVFSPCTRLADESFCDAVVDAMPTGRRFVVPLYATEAALHDRVVGRPGAHALVMQAIENLCARVGPEGVWIITVAVSQNLDSLADVARFAEQQGFVFSSHLPYPSFESRADRYFQAAPRMTAVADALVAAHHAGTRFGVRGLVPCVVFRRMRAASVPAREWLFVLKEPRVLPGTEYRDAKIRHRASPAGHGAFHAAAVPCPHAADCVLTQVCPAALLRSYVQMHGLDELSPVSLEDLVEAS